MCLPVSSILEQTMRTLLLVLLLDVFVGDAALPVVPAASRSAFPLIDTSNPQIEESNVVTMPTLSVDSPLNSRRQLQSAEDHAPMAIVAELHPPDSRSFCLPTIDHNNHGAISDAIDHDAKALDLDGNTGHFDLATDGTRYGGDLSFAVSIYAREAVYRTRVFEFSNGFRNSMIVLFFYAPGHVRFEYDDESENDNIHWVVEHELPLDKWVRLVVTTSTSNLPNRYPYNQWNGVAQTRLYMDGVEVAVGTSFAIPTVHRGMNYIGKGSDPQAPFFNGQVAEFHVWERVLSSDEVAALFVYSHDSVRSPSPAPSYSLGCPGPQRCGEGKFEKTGLQVHGKDVYMHYGQGKVLGYAPQGFWTISSTQSLFDVLDGGSFSTGCAVTTSDDPHRDWGAAYVATATYFVVEYEVKSGHHSEDHGNCAGTYTLSSHVIDSHPVYINEDGDRFIGWLHGMWVCAPLTGAWTDAVEAFQNGELDRQDVLIHHARGATDHFGQCHEMGGRSLPGSSSCFFVSYLYKSWEDAEDECRLLGGHLASLNGHSENELVNQLYKERGGLLLTPGGLWIGLTNANSNAAAHTEGWEWSDASSAAWENWAGGQPNNWRGNQHCAAIQRDDGKWGDDACSSSKPYACEVQTSTRCDSVAGSEWRTFRNDTCFFVPRVKGTWAQGETWCAALGGRLATIENEQENDLVYGLYDRSRARFWDNSIWIGMSDRDVEGKFVWNDGGLTEFVKWSQHEPNNWGGGQDCAVMWREHREWDDQQCDRIKSFVCAVNTRSVIDCEDWTWSYSYQDKTYFWTFNDANGRFRYEWEVCNDCHPGDGVRGWSFSDQVSRFPYTCYDDFWEALQLLPPSERRCPIPGCNGPDDD